MLRWTYSLAAMLLLLAAGGCVTDDFGDAGSSAPSEHTIGYMSMMLRMAGSDDDATRASDASANTTRADVGDSYEYGSAQELALCNEAFHYAVFYNEAEQATPLAVAELTGIASAESGNRTANATLVYAAIAARSEQKDLLERLRDCIVILNCNIPIEEFWGFTKDDLRSLRVSSPYFFSSKGERFFTMANAVYVEGGEAKLASEVNPEHVFTTALEAIEQVWKGNAAVTAYVERLSSKVKVRYADGVSQGSDAPVFTPANNGMTVFYDLVDGVPHYKKSVYPNLPDFNPYRYRVRLTGWGLNALEQETYLFRNVSPMANYFTGWNRPADHRCFWSEDVNYRRAEYPWQYRKAIDAPSVPYYEGKVNILRNLSFDELNHNPIGAAYDYAPENTYDFSDRTFASQLDGRPQLLAGTHVVVCAELLTNIENGVTFATHDLYRDRNGNFYMSERDVFLALVTIFNNSLRSHSFLKFTYYDFDRGGQKQQLFANTKGDYSLYYGDTRLTPENIAKISGQLTSEAEFKGSDGKRIIWMDNMSIRDQYGNPLQIYSNIDEVDSTKDRWLREATDNDVKSLLFEHIGDVDHFDGGRMYYAVPIGLVKDGAGNSQNDTYSVYGNVRNCVYDLAIHGVNGIGTSVDLSTQPIVSAYTETQDNLYISFDILDWHLTEQTVPGQIQ